MTDTLCITCGSPVRIVGGVTQSYEPVTAHDRSYVRVVAENTRLREQLEVMTAALDMIFVPPRPVGLPRSSEIARQALVRCKELENE